MWQLDPYTTHGKRSQTLSPLFFVETAGVGSRELILVLYLQVLNHVELGGLGNHVANHFGGLVLEKNGNSKIVV